MITAGVIVAAGLSSRMGEFKPLLPFRGSTIIENTINTMKRAGVDTIVVVIGYNKEVMEQALEGSNVIMVYNPNYATSDMMSSIKLGIECIIRIQETKENEVMSIDGLFILPGDMPAVSPDTFVKIYNEMEDSKAKIIFPTVLGRKKHPPLIQVELLQEIYNYQGDMGLRGALEQYEMDTAYLEVDDYGCTIDTDTQKDYKRLLEYE